MKTLEPRTPSSDLLSTDHVTIGLTEADLSAEIYSLCKKHGYEPHLEIKIPSSVHRSGYMRADVVGLKDGKLIFAMEVKRPEKRIKKKRKATERLPGT